MQDIPEALRYQEQAEKSSKKSRVLLLISGLLGIVTIATLISAFYLSNSSSDGVQTKQANVRVEKTQEKEPPIQQAAKATENLLGHLPYQEAQSSELKIITADGRIKLKKEAAQRYLQMQAAAKEDGILLKPISGFRSIQEQKYLFFKIKEKRGELASIRARVSAPPGYSEHHTGYAIDIGDAKVPATNLSPNFEKTAAFHWLKKNAARYSFELSFPKDNLQGINYEPWHWRYIGNLHSLETFYKAKNLK